MSVGGVSMPTVIEDNEKAEHVADLLRASHERQMNWQRWSEHRAAARMYVISTFLAVAAEGVAAQVRLLSLSLSLSLCVRLAALTCG